MDEFSLLFVAIDLKITNSRASFDPIDVLNQRQLLFESSFLDYEYIFEFYQLRPETKQKNLQEEIARERDVKTLLLSINANFRYTVFGVYNTVDKRTMYPLRRKRKNRSFLLDLTSKE
jgi:hypothetical protein